jgi:uncharacterized membrane protein YbhN (UPF0104 family)
MSKLDELKERIAYLKGFLTIAFGLLVLVSGGLINLYMKDNITIIFWLGSLLVFFIMFVLLKVMLKIESYLKKIGEL